MSADAAQRGAIQAVDLAAPAAVDQTHLFSHAPTVNSISLGHVVRPAESPHIARHLLLSVLLV